MINQKTLFILGAGASCPYGYPTGAGLRTDICNEKFLEEYKRLLGTSREFRVQKRRMELQEQAKLFVETFNGAYTKSIDEFISANHPLFDDIGRIAIAMSISRYEERSLFDEAIADGEKRKQDWYGLLFKRMTDGLSSPDGYKEFWNNKDKVKFITFNYDRSLEEYLYNGLICYWHKELVHESKLDEIIFSIEKKKVIPFEFVHIYGCFAKPSWDGGHPHREKLLYDELDKLKENVKVIGEERQYKELQEKMKELFEWADRIFFLGFGYSDENLSALDNNIMEWDDKHIFGTAFHSTDKEIRQIRTKISKILKKEDMDYTIPTLTDNIMPNPRIEPVECVSLLQELL